MTPIGSLDRAGRANADLRSVPDLRAAPGLRAAAPDLRAVPDLRAAIYSVERFDYVPDNLLLRLSVRVAFELASPVPVLLLVEHDTLERSYPPVLARTVRVPAKWPRQAAGSEWIWRGAFAVAPEIAFDARASFALRLRGDLLDLPVPSERYLAGAGVDSGGYTLSGAVIQAARVRAAHGRRHRSHANGLRRGALLLVLTGQLCLTSTWSGALADSGVAGTVVESAPEAPSSTPPASSTEAPAEAPSPTTPVSTAPIPSPTPPSSPPSGGRSGEAPVEGHSSSTPAGQPPAQGSPAPQPASTSAGAPQTGNTSPSTAPASSPPPAGTRVPITPEGVPVSKSSHAEQPSPRQLAHRAPPAHRVNPSSTAGRSRARTTDAAAPASAAPAGTNGVAPAPQLIAAETEALASEFASSAASTQALAFYRIPLFLLPIYQSAAAHYGVPWQILAAINEVETDYGSDLNVSSAGAVGWMQFMPQTWLQYGVDALDAGYADPYNPVDAIFAAARYLRAAGAEHDLRGAILAYNHSTEYADSVLLRAELISTYPKLLIGTLTGLVDAGLPVRGRALSWGALARARAGRAGAARSVGKESAARSAGEAAATATRGSSVPPAPAVAGRALPRTNATNGSDLQLVQLMSARNAAVVAVQDGRVIALGKSSKLGFYVVLRDVYGDVFTYAGLGDIARTYVRKPHASPGAPAHTPANPSAGGSAGAHANAPSGAPFGQIVSAAPRSGTAAAGDTAKARLLAHPAEPDPVPALGGAKATRTARRGARGPQRVPLRVGSLVTRGTVLGHVRVPVGAMDGHLRFAIRPAGDPATIDPRPILRSWLTLDAALHPRGASGEQPLLGATSGAVHARIARSSATRYTRTRAAHSAAAGRTVPSPLVVEDELTGGQWDALMTRVGVLPVPKIAFVPSSAAVPDAAGPAADAEPRAGQLPAGPRSPDG